VSQWTHVNGAFRFDYVAGVLPPLHWNDILGVDRPSELEEADWKLCSLPYGSEGPLLFNINPHPLRNHLNAFNVQVFGDLRDFGSERVEEIFRWFRGVCHRCQSGPPYPGIRDAVVTIDVEGGEYRLLTYVDGILSDRLVRKRV